MRPLALFALVVGCGLPPIDIDRSKLVEGPPGWAEAAEIACAEFGGACPTVYFYGPESMNCLDGRGWIYTDGDCIQGITGENGILIGLTRPDMLPHETVLSHEVAHSIVGDTWHKTPGLWGPDGDDWSPGSRLGDLNTALADRGL
jgi:hypothetical protein